MTVAFWWCHNLDCALYARARRHLTGSGDFASLSARFATSADEIAWEETDCPECGQKLRQAEPYEEI